MKVLVLGSLSSSLVNFRGPLIRAIVKAGHDVHAAAPNLLSDLPTRGWLEGCGVVCHDLPLKRTSLNAWRDLRYVASVRRLLNTSEFDVVFSYTAKPVIWGTLVAAWKRIPHRYALVSGLGYAFTPGGGLTRALLRFLSTGLYRLALRRATKVFFQNHDDANLFKELAVLKSKQPFAVVNGSGVDLTQFVPAPMRGGKPSYLLIARMLGAKEVREYVAAAEILREQCPGLTFELVGGLDANPDGIPIEEIRGWHDAGLVTWHGEVEDVRPFIANCHVFVFPSYYREGTPRSVLEAMAVGRPIITVDAPGCRETVVDGVNGFLVPPRKIQELAEAMLRFALEPALLEQMGRESRKIAEAKFDVNSVNAVLMSEMALS